MVHACGRRGKEPEEALSDDFLFPMGSLRLSYASSPESDLEATPGIIPNTGGSPRLVKSSSDPSIATQAENSPKLQHPPPYSPPHSHSHSQVNYDTNLKARHSIEKFGALPPELPPRIDRAVKPPRNNSGQRSAQERLFGSEPPNYINAALNNNQSSLERHNNKTSSYDSVSSYDSYNQRLGLGPNAHDDLKSCNGGPASPQRPVGHDPYRFTRSTQQPIKSLESPSKVKAPDFPKYRHATGPEYNTNKPTPPAKPTMTSYKPVPPPKPKNYRPPHQSYNQSNEYQHSKSYSIADNNYSSHLHNCVSSSPTKYSSENIEMNGHGSSLDRSTYGRSGSQYYYNIVPSPRQSHHREPSGLDLAHRADQRGSAFELYKKPTEPSSNHYMEHGLR